MATDAYCIMEFHGMLTALSMLLSDIAADIVGNRKNFDVENQ